MKSKWVFLSVLIVILLVLSGCGKSDQSYHVAIVSSETGDLAEIGKDMSRGAILAFEEINAAGGINGKMIDYVLFDDQGDPKNAVTVAQRVTQDNSIVGVVGHLTSGCMAAAAPVYNENGLAVSMPVPTNPAITQQGYNCVFRIPPTDAEQAPYLAHWLLEKHPDARVALVNDLTAYGNGFSNAFRDAFNQSGGVLVLDEGAQTGSRDFRTLITKLKSQRPDFVAIGATYDMGAPFVRQMREQGLDATVIAGDGMFGSEYIAQAGEAAEGSILSFIAPPRDYSERTRSFFDAFEARYGKVVAFAPLGYDAASVMAEALRHARDNSKAAVLDAFHDSTFVFEGITGKIAFKDNGDNEYPNLTLYEVKNGEFVLYTGE